MIMKILKKTSALAASILLLLTGCESQPQYTTENTYVPGRTTSICTLMGTII